MEKMFIRGRIVEAGDVVRQDDDGKLPRLPGLVVESSIDELRGGRNILFQDVVVLPSAHFEDLSREQAPVGVIFELVDNTNDENYWTLGLWHTLEAVLEQIREMERPEDVGCGDHEDYEEHAYFEIRERKIGWSGSGKTVARVTWTGTFDEATDDFKWTRKIELRAPLVGPGVGEQWFVVE